MKLLSIGPEPRHDRAASELLHDEPNARIVAFHLQAGQEIASHSSPSTVLLQVVSGHGTFIGEDTELRLSAGDGAVYAPGEAHAIRAGDGPLRFTAVITPRPRG